MSLTKHIHTLFFSLFLSVTLKCTPALIEKLSWSASKTGPVKTFYTEKNKEKVVCNKTVFLHRRVNAVLIPVPGSLSTRLITFLNLSKDN